MISLGNKVDTEYIKLIPARIIILLKVKFLFCGKSQYKIKSIVIPDPIDEVGYAAFYNNSLENVTIGKNVISLEIDSFGSSGPDHNYLRRVIIKGKSSASEFTGGYNPNWAWAEDVTCVKDNTENVENGCIIWEGSN